MVLELNLIAVKLEKEEALIDLLWWFVVLGTDFIYKCTRRRATELN
jgi:hypothetical protein